ncbi:MAG: beta-ketoacyl synthase N-terminal-like domain-containing protein [Pseudomonadota bacterium]
MSGLDGSRDVAIVGMAGLYPQAPDIDALWQNVLSRVDAVSEASDDWLGDDSIFDADSQEVHRIYTRRGGFLGNLARFDPREFGTMPLSIPGAQPDQFLALKLSRDALIDAGCVPGAFDGSSTGVILGHSLHVHRANTNGIHHVWFNPQIRTLLATLFPDAPEDRIREAVQAMQDKLPAISPESIPGLVPNVLTGRVANRLDLMGPNYIVDAACSSSLVSVKLAIDELVAGRADMMLAGGVNTTTSPLVYGVFCSVSALSRSGRIRPFDSEANGTVLGEGAGVIALKRLDDALAAEDRIYAVIKGLGVSSDGTSSGLMAPRLEGEVLAMRRAYEESGLDPASIGLLEAHGTGIPLGDRTEMEALQTVFGPREGAVPRVPIGSIKSMIGHCIPAAGSASMIKMALSLQNKIIPPTLCDEVSAEIGVHDSPFYVSTETRPWLHGAATPRRAAINAFGFGGINAHMILEEAPAGRASDPTAAFTLPVPSVAAAENVVFVAGADRAGLLEALAVVERSLDDGAEMSDLSRASWEAARKAGGPQRLAIVAGDREALAKKLAAAKSKLANADVRSLQTRNGTYFEAAPIEGKVAFLFPGEMAQYPGMLSDVAMAHPEARRWLDFICALFAGKRADRLEDVVLPPSSTLSAEGAAHLEAMLHRVDYGSELVFAADQAIFALLSAARIKPDAMLGHSTGENAALVASGVLGLDRDAAGEMIADMNAAFSTVEESGEVPRGVLLTIAALERPKLEALMEGRDGLHFTMDNCPNQAVVFGGQDAVDALERAAVAQGAVCTRLPISWGYHTEFVRPMAQAFGQLFQRLPVAETDVTLYSCATARPFPMEQAAFLDTAMAQYTSRVRFTEAVEQLYADGHRIFVECGPNAVLTAFVRDILGDRAHLAESADNRRRGTLAQLRHLVARLFAAGVDLDPAIVMPPQETADRARRREARERFLAAPALKSDLPYVRFDADEAEALRSLLQGGSASPSSARVETPLAAPAAVASAPTTGAAPRQTAGGAGAMQGHIGLMRDFVSAQGRVAETALGGSNGHAGDTDAVRIEYVDIAARFELPFAFRAYLMRGAPTLDAVLPHLSDAERHEAQAIADRSGHGRALQEWMLSRIATKRAAAELMAAQSGIRLPDHGLSVVKTAEGAPILAVEREPDAAPAISISHAESCGLGAAAQRGVSIGVDFEAPTKLRDPCAFAETILSAEERALMGGCGDAVAATAAWSMKEAAAKALGVGLQGRPLEFRIKAFETSSGSARIEHGSMQLWAGARWVGDGVCAVSYPTAS